MDVFLIKITNRDNVDNILSKRHFIHQDIYNFEKEIKEQDYVFFVFSGDKSKIDWPQGLAGFGQIVRAPFDKGYNKEKQRYFRIEIKAMFILRNPINPKFTKLHPKYQNELFDVPYVGANHFPNQAIAKTTGRSAEVLFLLMKDVDLLSIKNLDFDFLKDKNVNIKDSFRLYLESKNKPSSVSSYINALSNMPQYLIEKGIKCPDPWVKDVDIQLLKEAGNFVKEEKKKESGGLLSEYYPHSHWNNGWFYSGVNNLINFLNLIDKRSKTIIEEGSHIQIPISEYSLNQFQLSSFIILAGSSGTGKSRWVREQAEQSSPYENKFNYCIVPVRPDWHEPSDLLGYESRLSETYVATNFLRFTIKAHYYNLNPIEIDGADPYSPPFWCCLDEMNLAPVEQYFADYLAILETRKWEDGVYTCDPLMSPELLSSEICNNLKEDLKPKNIDDTQYEELWDHFISEGINLPPNLIVAGTVNMDETTHQFSRKVLDRAMTIDFNEFYPNNFEEYFEKIRIPKTLGYPTLTSVTKEDLKNISADEDGSLSIKFLSDLNDKLTGTPFELAYRAINQLLLMVVQFAPKDEIELLSVWDDFIMMKLLPRIEGDVDKLSTEGDNSILAEINTVLSTVFSKIWDGEIRIDLLRVNDSHTFKVECRSRNKIQWMIDRLDNGYTSFWP